VSTILDKIVATKRQEVAERKATTPTELLNNRIQQCTAPRGFADSLRRALDNQQPGVIAEIKKASPSKGVIRESFDPVSIAKSYADHGAACLSVLTDEQYFQGSDQFLRDVVQNVSLPALRKDFMIDEYQIRESRALGADCVLLIAACLDIMQLTVLHGIARDLDMDVLIEVHDQAELEAALSLQPKIIGINNRNLKTFETRLETTLELLPLIPDAVTVVTESGIRSAADVERMRSNHVNCFLVGEAFMRAQDPGAQLETLFYRS